MALRVVIPGSRQAGFWEPATREESGKRERESTKKEKGGALREANDTTTAQTVIQKAREEKLHGPDLT